MPLIGIGYWLFINTEFLYPTFPSRHLYPSLWGLRSKPCAESCTMRVQFREVVLLLHVFFEGSSAYYYYLNLKFDYLSSRISRSSQTYDLPPGLPQTSNQRHTAGPSLVLPSWNSSGRVCLFLGLIRFVVAPLYLSGKCYLTKKV